MALHFFNIVRGLLENEHEESLCIESQCLSRRSLLKTWSFSVRRKFFRIFPDSSPGSNHLRTIAWDQNDPYRPAVDLIQDDHVPSLSSDRISLSQQYRGGYFHVSSSLR